MVKPVVVLLKNFHILTRVTDVVRLLGSLLGLHGKKWNSIYCVSKLKHDTPRTCSFIVKLRDITYWHSLKHATHVDFDSRNGIIRFRYRNRSIRGARLMEGTYKLAAGRVEDSDDRNIFAASVRRSDKDMLDMVIRLENHFGHALDYICALSVSPKKFYIEVLSGDVLYDFLQNEYFLGSSKLSDTFISIDLCNRVLVR